MLADVLQQGLRHAATALLADAKSAVLSTVAWSGDFDSRLVAARGTLVNLVAALAFWLPVKQREKCIGSRALFLLTNLASISGR